MTKPNFIFSAAFLLVCFSTNSLAQTPPAKERAEPNYEIVLQVLTASNNAADNKQTAAAVPQTLAGVVKKLKNIYAFSNYRLTSTYLQRIANTGNVLSNDISNEASQNADAPVFSEWAIDQMLILPDAKGQDSIAIRNFRFGQRVPVKTASFAAENGKSNAVVNYERVGLTMQKLGFPVNSPTVVGTLSASKPDELMFLILTVKPTDE